MSLYLSYHLRFLYYQVKSWLWNNRHETSKSQYCQTLQARDYSADYAFSALSSSSPAKVHENDPIQSKLLLHGLDLIKLFWCLVSLPFQGSKPIPSPLYPFRHFIQLFYQLPLPPCGHSLFLLFLQSFQLKIDGRLH